jgi:transcriptional regulator with XRE-family HTH domain
MFKLNREEKILNLIKEKYKSVREFSNITGIPNSTIVSMLKKGLGGTSVDTVLLVCKFLNISIEELNQTTKNQPQENLTTDEKELIECYKVCSNENKAELLMLARYNALKNTLAAEGKEA